MFSFRKFRRRRRLAKKGLEARRKRRNAATASTAVPRTPASKVLVPALIAAIVWFVASATVIYRRGYTSYQYVVGQIADRNIYSEIDFQYEDMGETRRLREQAARRVPPVYRIDRYVGDNVLKELAALKTRAELAHSDNAAAEKPDEPPVRESRLERLLTALPEADVAALEYLATAKDRWKYLRRLIADGLARGVAGEQDVISDFGGTAVNGRICLIDHEGRKSEVVVVKLATPTTLARSVARDLGHQFPENAKALIHALEAVLPTLILPNLTYDAKATEAARDEARKKVAPVRRVVRAETLLLRRGARVTEEDLTRLAEHQKALRARLGLAEAPRNMVVFAILCMMLVLGAGYALKVIRPEAVRRHSSLCILATGVVLQVVAARVTADVYYHYWSLSVDLFPILPLSLGAMLISPLDGVRVALVAGAFTSTIAGIQNDRSFEVLLIGVFSSLAAAVSIRRARRRNHIFRTGLAVSATVFAVYTLFAIHNRLPLPQFPRILGLSLINGVIMATVVYTVLPFFEHVFGRTTDMTLIELSDLNHPLLKKLQMEAPGTYHHSLMVATLAEQAAEAIGANALLARVCAYFHDIGKLAHPEYFAENLAGENPHQELQPRMSGRVILNHVKEGMELAQKYRLQRVIREAIAQHHGTSLVYYFFRRALDQAGTNSRKESVDETDYRYPGPRPMRKEIALISIADPCEAAARTLEKPTPQKISQMVDEIVDRRVKDGQLALADLTFRELTLAKEQIAKTLVTMLHSRVPYPTEEGGANDRQPDQSSAKGAAPGPARPGASAAGTPAGNGTPSTRT
ncbi:MAG: HDIG domain-containing protein [Kiritimatiellaeota bacterium]|nr:HDIG domain-containing protein [Kiritimatiellota bacterium]